MTDHTARLIIVWTELLADALADRAPKLAMSLEREVARLLCRVIEGPEPRVLALPMRNVTPSGDFSL